MTKIRLAGAVAILSTMIVTPVLAQAAIQEPGAYAFYHSYAGSAVEYTGNGLREANGRGPIVMRHKLASKPRHYSHQ